MTASEAKRRKLPVKFGSAKPETLRKPAHGVLAAETATAIIEAAPVHAAAEGQNNPRRRGVMGRIARRVFGYGGTFVMCVLLPSLAATIYLLFLASDQYVAETRFAVRSASFSVRSPSTPNPSSSSSGLPVIASQDAYVIGSYIRSAAILNDLPAQLKPEVIYTKPEADPWARLTPGAGLEAVTRYWRGMTNVYVEQSSGIVTVRVRAFSPEDARDVLQAILAASEKLVNDMSLNARRDALANAEAEVAKTQANVEKALADMRKFRDKYGMINPVSAAGNVSALLLQAMSQRISLKAQYEVAARSLSPNAPSVKRIQGRIDAVEKQIKELESELTSKNSNVETVSSTIAEFEQLEMRRLFAEKINITAQDALERARERVERQNVYVAVFVPPMLPEYPEHPKRYSLSLLIAFGLLTLWGIFALIAAAIGDHKY